MDFARIDRNVDLPCQLLANAVKYISQLNEGELFVKEDVDLKKILPLACHWADIQENILMNKGNRLSPEWMDWAAGVGVACPHKIRTLIVREIPQPEHPVLRYACSQTQLITEKTIGLTLGYGIFIKKEASEIKRVYLHEFAHVAQFERLGGIERFLEKYISEVLLHGYHEAPMEKEAVAAEDLGSRDVR